MTTTSFGTFLWTSNMRSSRVFERPKAAWPQRHVKATTRLIIVFIVLAPFYLVTATARFFAAQVGHTHLPLYLRQPLPYQTFRHSLLLLAMIRRCS